MVVAETFFLAYSAGYLAVSAYHCVHTIRRQSRLKRIREVKSRGENYLQLCDSIPDVHPDDSLLSAACRSLAATYAVTPADIQVNFSRGFYTDADTCTRPMKITAAASHHHGSGGCFSDIQLCPAGCVHSYNTNDTIGYSVPALLDPRNETFADELTRLIQEDMREREALAARISNMYRVGYEFNDHGEIRYYFYDEHGNKHTVYAREDVEVFDDEGLMTYISRDHPDVVSALSADASVNSSDVDSGYIESEGSVHDEVSFDESEDSSQILNLHQSVSFDLRSVLSVSDDDISASYDHQPGSFPVYIQDHDRDADDYAQPVYHIPAAYPSDQSDDVGGISKSEDSSGSVLHTSAYDFSGVICSDVVHGHGQHRCVAPSQIVLFRGITPHDSEGVGLGSFSSTAFRDDNYLGLDSSTALSSLRRFSDSDFEESTIIDSVETSSRDIGYPPVLRLVSFPAVVVAPMMTIAHDLESVDRFLSQPHIRQYFSTGEPPYFALFDDLNVDFNSSYWSRFCSFCYQYYHVPFIELLHTFGVSFISTCRDCVYRGVVIIIRVVRGFIMYSNRVIWAFVCNPNLLVESFIIFVLFSLLLSTVSATSFSRSCNMYTSLPDTLIVSRWASLPAVDTLVTMMQGMDFNIQVNRTDLLICVSKLYQKPPFSLTERFPADARYFDLSGSAWLVALQNLTSALSVRGRSRDGGPGFTDSIRAAIAARANIEKIFYECVGMYDREKFEAEKKLTWIEPAPKPVVEPKSVDIDAIASRVIAAIRAEPARIAQPSSSQPPSQSRPRDSYYVAQEDIIQDDFRLTRDTE